MPPSDLVYAHTVCPIGPPHIGLDPEEDPFFEELNALYNYWV